MKHDEDSADAVEEKKPVMKPIPFPEKVYNIHEHPELDPGLS